MYNCDITNGVSVTRRSTNETADPNGVKSDNYSRTSGLVLQPVASEKPKSRRPRQQTCSVPDFRPSASKFESWVKSCGQDIAPCCWLSIVINPGWGPTVFLGCFSTTLTTRMQAPVTKEHDILAVAATASLTVNDHSNTPEINTLDVENPLSPVVPTHDIQPQPDIEHVFVHDDPRQWSTTRKVCVSAETVSTLTECLKSPSHWLL